MNRTTIDLWVGVFVAIGIAALLFLALKVGSITSGNIVKGGVVSASCIWILAEDSTKMMLLLCHI